MPSYATGPAHHTSGPIADVYADGALERGCGNCGSEAGSFCRRADGSFKPVPCCARLKGGNAADGQTGAQRGAETATTTQGEQPHD